MFTGLIEQLGTVKSIEKLEANLIITLEASFAHELSIDESVAHNGICLTVTEVYGNEYKVAAVRETIAKTTTANWQVGNIINLERAMKIGDRLGGHIVQGHVDSTATVIHKENAMGSTVFTFSHDAEYDYLVIEKGSITINGTSLTLFDVKDGQFSVTIIPYTIDHTNFQVLNIGDVVNIEYDILGKYFHKNAAVFFQR